MMKIPGTMSDTAPLIASSPRAYEPPAPAGYRRLSVGETIERGDLIWRTITKAGTSPYWSETYLAGDKVRDAFFCRKTAKSFELLPGYRLLSVGEIREPGDYWLDTVTGINPPVWEPVVHTEGYRILPGGSPCCRKLESLNAAEKIKVFSVQFTLRPDCVRETTTHTAQVTRRALHAALDEYLDYALRLKNVPKLPHGIMTGAVEFDKKNT